MSAWLAVAVLGWVLGLLIMVILLGSAAAIARSWAAHCEEREIRRAHHRTAQSFGWVEHVEPGATWEGE